MNVGFGKHTDLEVEQLVLKHPDYVSWLLVQSGVKGRMAAVCSDIQKRLIPAFNKRPYQKICDGSSCNATATRATGYAGNPYSIYFWCNSCDPYSLGAIQGKLTLLTTYSEMLTFARMCGGNKADYQAVVKKVAEAKGQPKRLTKTAAIAFFK